MMSGRSRPAVRRRTAVAVALALATLWLALRLSSRLIRRVRGSSMAPTLRPGDVVLVVPAPPRVGDVAVLRDPRAPDRETVKRVTAAAGTLADLAGDVAPVPAGHVAVRGDDPLASTDSRRYGAVPRSAIVARVVARVWPPPLRSL